MSTTALTGLLEYLYGTLSTSNMRWVAEHLMEYADKEEQQLKPYTMEEINTMLDKAEANIAAGNVIDDEDVWRELEEEFKKEDAYEDARQATSPVEKLQLEAV